MVKIKRKRNREGVSLYTLNEEIIIIGAVTERLNGINFLSQPVENLIISVESVSEYYRSLEYVSGFKIDRKFTKDSVIAFVKNWANLFEIKGTICRVKIEDLLSGYVWGQDLRNLTKENKEEIIYNLCDSLGVDRSSLASLHIMNK